MARVSLLAGYVVSSGGCWFFQFAYTGHRAFYTDRSFTVVAWIPLAHGYPLALGLPQYKTLSLPWPYDPGKG